MPEDNEFNFQLSLSVLDHLGRGLYRNFITILGEAISNSWDADAKNVYIDYKKQTNILIIKDDGIGMSAEDFQTKFLKVGYSKRTDASQSNYQGNSPGGRPYIGRKGIGKLALLSCSEKVSILSKDSSGSEYVGGVIDNEELDDSIKKDIEAGDYKLGRKNEEEFKGYTDESFQGTIIKFDNLKEGVHGSIRRLRELIALSFKFNLVADKDLPFTIHFNDEPITDKDLKKLSDKTQFLWEGKNNEIENPYFKNLGTENGIKKDHREKIEFSMSGVDFFIASVEKPSDLNIFGMGEKIGIDLFVNGRVRVTNLIKKMPRFSSRVFSNYIYGEIHDNSLEGESDAFTSGRDDVVPDNERYLELIEKFEAEILLKQIDPRWDEWRIKINKEGDPENTKNLSKINRKAVEMSQFIMDSIGISSEYDKWNEKIKSQAAYNSSAYTTSYIIENLLREAIEYKVADNDSTVINKLEHDTHKNNIDEYRRKEKVAEKRGNVGIDIRQDEYRFGLSYLDASELAKILEPESTTNSLDVDIKSYRPIRNAMAHTALLTRKAQKRLDSILDNVGGKLKKLLPDKAISKSS